LASADIFQSVLFHADEIKGFDHRVFPPENLRSAKHQNHEGTMTPLQI